MKFIWKLFGDVKVCLFGSYPKKYHRHLDIICDRYDRGIMSDDKFDRLIDKLDEWVDVELSK